MGLNEKELMASIISAAKDCGWKVYHTWRSFHSPAGFPDLILVRNGKILSWELKSEKGVVKPAQQEWLDELRGAVVVDSKVIRPVDLEEAYKALVEL